MPSGRRDILVPIRWASRPGGLAYGDIACLETGRALLRGTSPKGVRMLIESTLQITQTLQKMKLENEKETGVGNNFQPLSDDVSGGKTGPTRFLVRGILN